MKEDSRIDGNAIFDTEDPQIRHRMTLRSICEDFRLKQFEDVAVQWAPVLRKDEGFQGWHSEQHVTEQLCQVLFSGHVSHAQRRYIAERKVGIETGETTYHRTIVKYAEYATASIVRHGILDGEPSKERSVDWKNYTSMSW